MVQVFVDGVGSEALIAALELLYYGEQLGLARALEVLYYGGWEPVLPHELELVLLLELLESLADVLQLELVLLVDV